MSLIQRWWHVDDGGDDPQAMYWTDSEDTARLARESGYGVVEYVPADQLAGAVDALHEAIQLARDFNRGAMTWQEYDRKLAALEAAHPGGQ